MKDYIVTQITEAQRVILMAFEEARFWELVCIGLTGNRGGTMTELCDYLQEVPSSDTPNIQKGYLVLGHILCGLAKDQLSIRPA